MILPPSDPNAALHSFVLYKVEPLQRGKGPYLLCQYLILRPIQGPAQPITKAELQAGLDAKTDIYAMLPDIFGVRIGLN